MTWAEWRAPERPPPRSAASAGNLQQNPIGCRLSPVNNVSSLHSTRGAPVPPVLSGLRSGLPTRSTRAMTPADGRQRRRRGRRTALFSGMHPQPLARLRLIASSKEPSIACDYGNFTVAEGLTEPEPRSRTLALWERAKRPLGECGVRDASLIAPTPAR